MQQPVLDSLRLQGHVADHLECFARERILSDYAHNVVYRETEDAFRNRKDDSFGADALWQGEFWGKWMIGAVRYCEYAEDAELKAFIRQSVHTLIGMQEPSGYIGTYRDPMNVFVLDPVVSEKKFGVKSKWNWNIWCRKYTLWGLVEAYRLLGDPVILDAASKLATHLIHSLREHGIRLGSTGTFVGTPSGSILKPVVLLYRATGNAEFLEFAKQIAADWQHEKDLCPNLITNALSGKLAADWYPEPKDWAKAYEVMSCFEGLIELYRTTGEADLLRSAACFHTELKKGEANVVHSVGYNDIFHGASSQINCITEPCDVIHWMRLCGELFIETGERVYLDDFELAFYNAFLASVCRDGKWGARGVRSHGRHYYVLEQAHMKCNHCCVNNVPRGFLNFAQMSATTRGNTVSVNFYSPFTAALQLAGNGSVRLDVSGDYLGQGEVCVNWDADLSAAATLRLRVPGWATSAILELGGAVRHAEGEWFEVALHAGKGSATLRFGRELVIRHHRAPTDVADWYVARWDNWEKSGMRELFRVEDGSTLHYGPLLLARSKFIGNTEAEMFGAALAPGFAVSLEPLASDSVAYAFTAQIESAGQTFTTRVCDFASAGNVMQEDIHLFSVFF